MSASVQQIDLDPEPARSSAACTPAIHPYTREAPTADDTFINLGSPSPLSHQLLDLTGSTASPLLATGHARPSIGVKDHWHIVPRLVQLLNPALLHSYMMSQKGQTITIASAPAAATRSSLRRGIARPCFVRARMPPPQHCSGLVIDRFGARAVIRRPGCAGFPVVEPSWASTGFR